MALQQIVASVHQVGACYSVLNGNVGLHEGAKVVGKAHQLSVNRRKFRAVVFLVQFFKRNACVFFVAQNSVFKFIAGPIHELRGIKVFHQGNKLAAHDFVLYALDYLRKSIRGLLDGANDVARDSFRQIMEKRGKEIVVNTFVLSYYFKSKSEGKSEEENELIQIYGSKLKKKWSKIFEKRDPYFSPNFRNDITRMRVNPQKVK